MFVFLMNFYCGKCSFVNLATIVKATNSCAFDKTDIYLMNNMIIVGIRIWTEKLSSLTYAVAKAVSDVLSGSPSEREWTSQT